jgi:hypothetical protein
MHVLGDEMISSTHLRGFLTMLASFGALTGGRGGSIQDLPPNAIIVGSPLAGLAAVLDIMDQGNPPDPQNAGVDTKQETLPTAKFAYCQKLLLSTSNENPLLMIRSTLQNSNTRNNIRKQ